MLLNWKDGEIRIYKCDKKWIYDENEKKKLVRNYTYVPILFYDGNLSFSLFNCGGDISFSSRIPDNEYSKKLLNFLYSVKSSSSSFKKEILIMDRNTFTVNAHYIEDRRLITPGGNYIVLSVECIWDGTIDIGRRLWVEFNKNGIVLKENKEDLRLMFNGRILSSENIDEFTEGVNVLNNEIK